MNDAPQTVLIVDDDRISRTMLAEVLRDDCRVVLARDGESALDRLTRDGDISLVLLDITMPGLSGYDVLMRMRRDEQTRDIPVIFISGLSDEDDESRGLELGAVDYVFKPIRPAIARARILNHLKLVSQRNELERLANRDGLTGIANRRYFDIAFRAACLRASRQGEPLSLAMIDVDRFKQYNDFYGHPAGDDALRKIASVVAGYATGPHDVAARYGGEEFALLLPGLANLGALPDELRLDVAALGLEHLRSSVKPVVTISVGVVSSEGHLDRTPEQFLQQADALLYEAKQNGRDRVAVAQIGAQFAASR